MMEQSWQEADPIRLAGGVQLLQTTVDAWCAAQLICPELNIRFGLIMIFFFLWTLTCSPRFLIAFRAQSSSLLGRDLMPPSRLPAAQAHTRCCCPLVAALFTTMTTNTTASHTLFVYLDFKAHSIYAPIFIRLLPLGVKHVYVYRKLEHGRFRQGLWCHVQSLWEVSVIKTII